MRGSYHNFLLQTSRLTPAVEEAALRVKEAAELRLARIQNGKEPGHKNGKCCGGKCKTARAK